eukprot:CAMPEP_0170626356 /NCGR_PEP_ID=MMETSP0224-20130122/31313_1 /TAXON_ID=285029 /ORGANISM="Togula jolla, Strain CCCM 725" /LENGTH=67 /DNA_ID=CAMNT_0010953121 /DNA_START=66 /DNA_END=269 /DNA_ORIENTATION=-
MKAIVLLCLLSAAGAADTLKCNTETCPMIVEKRGACPGWFQTRTLEEQSGEACGSDMAWTKCFGGVR